ncbi:ATP-binding protein [Marinobacterium aestuariivivens]|uniref:ATP-binding protein n=1 Tax=Marinobacterium aestuariivivens TaxID=1698799 RepID=A0ABW2A1A4_9GAMM
MNSPTPQQAVESTPTLDAEWLRLEVLGRCLLDSRSGRAPDSDTLKQLQNLQAQVVQLRNGPFSPWRRLLRTQAPPLAMDLLACVIGPQAHPPLAWIYRDLNGGQHHHASAVLIHALLALDVDENERLHYLIRNLACGEDRLLDVSAEDVTAAIRAEPGTLSRLLQRPEVSSIPGASRVGGEARFDALVLPPDRLGLLREFSYHFKYREKVVDAWGARSSGGPVALFSGASGTGKTFAAQVLANELGWPLYRVDLASLVSKYIGETEKNLSRLFDAAHRRPVVLLFDEVDALMGKRGEIKDARDRYANMEVSYLLTRMEAHEGPCILTTNLRAQLDQAFLRRLHLVVEFPKPQAAERARLWRVLLPPRAPLAGDVDLEQLAQAVNLTGGQIRNAALYAAYLAAADDGAIQLGHIATAVWRELSKERTRLQPGDLGQLAAYLPEHLIAEATG